MRQAKVSAVPAATVPRTGASRKALSSTSAGPFYLSPLCVPNGRHWDSKLTNSTTRSVMTLCRLYGLIVQGFGQGRNEAYKSWIRVTRSVSSPKSNLQVMLVPIVGGKLHLLAGTEYDAALLAVYLGAAEVRTQFPLWPSPSQSPLAGLHADRDCSLPVIPGLLDIAREAGIDHGTYIGTSIPFVATCDLVLRIGAPPDDRLVFWSVKPLSKIVSGDVAIRVRERIELDRRFAVASGGGHRTIVGNEMSIALKGNLGWMMPTLSSLVTLRQSNQLGDFSGEFCDRSAHVDTLSGCIESSGTAASLDSKQAQEVFRAAAWLGLVDVDLTRPVVMSRPPTFGGIQKAAQLRAMLLGDER